MEERTFKCECQNNKEIKVKRLSDGTEICPEAGNIQCLLACQNCSFIQIYHHLDPLKLSLNDFAKVFSV